MRLTGTTGMLENIQRSATKLIPGLKDLNYGVRLNNE